MSLQRSSSVLAIRAAVEQIQRLSISIKGITQGVGFRPFVYRLARQFALTGFVQNEQAGVFIEAEGRRPSLDAFILLIRSKHPPLAKIEDFQVQATLPKYETSFGIKSSLTNSKDNSFIPPDIATCDSCRSELFDPVNRRYRYPFINCIDCGPRLTMMRSAPFDRERTTMASFSICADCTTEYQTPEDRRFHAQSIACSNCGPKLSLLNAQGELLPTKDPIGQVTSAIRAGGIVAIKSLGGYHLACDATHEHAVSGASPSQISSGKTFRYPGKRSNRSGRTLPSFGS